MKVEELKSGVTILHLNELESLDPVMVHLWDQGPGAGSITVTCYGRSWTMFWGGMGDRGIEEFVAQTDSSYLTTKLGYGSGPRPTKKDLDYLRRICDAVIEALRVRRGALTPT